MQWFNRHWIAVKDALANAIFWETVFSPRSNAAPWSKVMLLVEHSRNIFLASWCFKSLVELLPIKRTMTKHKKQSIQFKSAKNTENHRPRWFLGVSSVNRGQHVEEAHGDTLQNPKPGAVWRAWSHCDTLEMELRKEVTKAIASSIAPEPGERAGRVAGCWMVAGSISCCFEMLPMIYRNFSIPLLVGTGWCPGSLAKWVQIIPITMATMVYGNIYIYIIWNIFLFFHILSSSQLTNSYFSEGLKPPTSVYIYIYILTMVYKPTFTSLLRHHLVYPTIFHVFFWGGTTGECSGVASDRWFRSALWYGLWVPPCHWAETGACGSNASDTCDFNNTNGDFTKDVRT